MFSLTRTEETIDDVSPPLPPAPVTSRFQGGVFSESGIYFILKEVCHLVKNTLCNRQIPRFGGKFPMKFLRGNFFGNFVYFWGNFLLIIAPEVINPLYGTSPNYRQFQV